MLGAANTRTSQEVKQLIEKCWVQALVCSPALKALRIFSDPQCVTKMFTWHKQTAKYFSSKKMGLFGISRELQFGICKHESSDVSSCMARKEYSYKKEKKIKKAIVNKAFMAFHWLKTCQERRVCILPVQLVYCHTLYKASPSLAANNIINLISGLMIWSWAQAAASWHTERGREELPHVPCPLA